MTRKRTSLVGAVVAAGLVASGLAAASIAAADSGDWATWTEGENKAPYPVVGGLVYHKGAQLNWARSVPGPNPAPFAEVEAIAPLSEIDGLGYTVAHGTTYAPSFQIIVTSQSENVTYARLVWEPYMQGGDLGDFSGEYTNLEDGLWWGNRVFVDGVGSSPFGNGEGSQSKPQPLSYFQDFFGDDAEVKAVSIQQGTTTEGTHVVTSLAIEGEEVALGEADTTPFSAADLTDAVNDAKAPLHEELAEASATIGALQAQVSALQGQLADAQSKLSAAEKAASDAQAEAVAAKSAATTAQKAAAKAADATLKAQAAQPYTVSGTLKVGKTLKAKGTKVKGISVKYQWYVGGKKAGTKASLKLKKSHAGKTVRVVVTKTYKTSAGKKVSVKTTTWAGRGTVSR